MENQIETIVQIYNYTEGWVSFIFPSTGQAFGFIQDCIDKDSETDFRVQRNDR